MDNEELVKQDEQAPEEDAVVEEAVEKAEESVSEPEPVQAEAPQPAPEPVEAPQPAQPQYTEPAPVQQPKGSSFGWAVLGFFIPIVGLILFLVWGKTRPEDAKAAGKGALISVIISVVAYALMMCAAGAAMMQSGM
ncbi:MAG: hypothetical protein IKF07_04325 [Eubacterium sp.]|nr:hypothetical protein [Eubacterium sp.]